MVGIGRRGRFEIAAILSLTLALGARSGPAWAQVPLEPTDPGGLQETLSGQIEETSIEIPDAETEPVDSAVDGVADATEPSGAGSTTPLGADSTTQTAASEGGWRGETVESHGEQGPRVRGNQSVAGLGGKAALLLAAGRVRTPAEVTACPQEDGRWVVVEDEPFGGHWQGPPASGILVFSSTRREVRFDLDEGFALEAVCWQTSNGVGGSDARLESIDPDTYAVTMQGRSAAVLEQLTFNVAPPPGQESEEGVLGLVIRRGDLATTGLRLVGLGALNLLLLLSGAALLRLGRRHPRHTRPSLI